MHLRSEGVAEVSGESHKQAVTQELGEKGQLLSEAPPAPCAHTLSSSHYPRPLHSLTGPALHCDGPAHTQTLFCPGVQ